MASYVSANVSENTVWSPYLINYFCRHKQKIGSLGFQIWCHWVKQHQSINYVKRAKNGLKNHWNISWSMPFTLRAKFLIIEVSNVPKELMLFRGQLFLLTFPCRLQPFQYHTFYFQGPLSELVRDWGSQDLSLDANVEKQLQIQIWIEIQRVMYLSWTCSWILMWRNSCVAQIHQKPNSCVALSYDSICQVLPATSLVNKLKNIFRAVWKEIHFH